MGKFVWIFEYCPCVYESYYGTQSVHETEESANTAMSRHKKPVNGFEDMRVRKMPVKLLTKKAKKL